MRPSGCAERAFPLLLLCACGDPLVSGDYAGEPLLTLTGQVRYADDYVEPDAPILVDILWSERQDESQKGVAVMVSTQFPGEYTLTLYNPPEADLLVPTPLDANVYSGIGAPVVYADEDGDGTYVPDTDLLWGGTDDVAILYLSDDLAAPAGVTNPDGSPAETIDAGFHLIGVDEHFCDQVSPPDLLDDQDVELTVSDSSYVPLVACDPPP